MYFPMVIPKDYADIPSIHSSSMAAITSGERELGGEVDPGKWRPNSVISTFSPRELGKRASTFMADWERSLASPTGGVADGLGKGGKVD